MLVATQEHSSETAVDKTEEGGDDVKSSCPLCPGPVSYTHLSEFVDGFKAWLNANFDAYNDNGGNDIVAAVSALGFDAYNVACLLYTSPAGQQLH